MTKDRPLYTIRTTLQRRGVYKQIQVISEVLRRADQELEAFVEDEIERDGWEPVALGKEP